MTFWELTFDGWFGAVVGSVAAVGVAVFVLRRTLAHERSQFAEQLRAERELAVWQRQLELFGEVTAAASRLGIASTDPDKLLVAIESFGTTMRRWRMYTSPSDGTFPHDIEMLGFHLERASWRAREEEVERAKVEGRRPRVRVAVPGVTELTVDLMAYGRRWHQEPEHRADVERWAAEAVATAKRTWPKEF
jgi:hypothetical protein